MANINIRSPYARTPIINGYLDVLSFIDIPAESDDVQYTLTTPYMHRPDLLAYEIYNDPELWWVFAVRNKDVIKDSIYDFVPGQTIFLPKLTTIKKILGN
jgi:hypothetical protein